jgi:hypothetical protein
MQPVIYQVTQKQLGRDDLTEFLRRAISKQFEGKEYYVTKEEDITKPTHYSKTPRRLRGFLINENNTIGHSIWFDVTDVSSTTWLG